MDGFARTRSPRRGRWLWIMGLLLVCTACNRGMVKKTAHPVRGQVFFEGKPVEGAFVVFHPAEDTEASERPLGRTDKDGYFNLSTYATNDGAPAGSYLVTVEWKKIAKSGGGYDRDVEGPNLLPKKYSLKQLTTLKADVSAGTNELPPFRLFR